VIYIINCSVKHNVISTEIYFVIKDKTYRREISIGMTFADQNYTKHATRYKRHRTKIRAEIRSRTRRACRVLLNSILPLV